MGIFSKGLTQLTAFIEVGGPVVAILLIMSVIALAIILVKLAMLASSGIGRTKVLDVILSQIDEGANEAEGLQNLKGTMPTIANRAWQLRERAHANNGNLGEARERVLIDADHDLARLDWGNRLLELIAQIAPLLGLFGTVLGMISAFRALQAGGSVVDPAVLAGGIWVALLTTATGLAVAMPVSMALSFFEAQSDKARLRAERIIEVIFRPNATKQYEG